VRSAILVQIGTIWLAACTDSADSTAPDVEFPPLVNPHSISPDPELSRSFNDVAASLVPQAAQQSSHRPSRDTTR
jgi:hypothetical protein